jgi:hypothetical protein
LTINLAKGLFQSLPGNLSFCGNLWKQSHA